MTDMLEVEGQLEAATENTIAPTESEADFGETASTHGGDFDGSHKSGTWKKFKKIMKSGHRPAIQVSVSSTLCLYCCSCSVVLQL